MAENINLTFLGTGSSIPTARRNHFSSLLKYRDETILIDCGEGTQRQFRKSRLNMSKLTRILITHWHADHVLGLPGLLTSLVANGYNRSLKIYGPSGSKRKVAELVQLYNIDSSALQLEVFDVSDKVFVSDEYFEIIYSSMDHGTPCNAYSFVVKEKMRIDKAKLKKLNIPSGPHLKDLSLGKTVMVNGSKFDSKNLLYKEDGKKITFVLDTLYNKNAEKLAKNSDILVCESSFSAEEKETAHDHMHMTSVDAAKLAKKSSSKKLFLVHLSQRYDAVPKLILSEAKKEFKEVFVPEDLDSVEI